MKKINEIVKGASGCVECVANCAIDYPITSVEYDSRKAAPGSLFVAVEGFESDGHRFINGAVERGCRAVLLSSSRLDEFSGLASQGVTLLVSQNTRRALSAVSSVFCGNPSASLHVTGVTGTNGKTSITYILETIYKSLGISCGVIGTVNYRWGGNVIPAPNTTPESADIQALMARMRDDGVTHVVMEVSSHALELNRVDDIEFDTVIFTNLTGDHLDFHKNIESYFLAKRRLFGLLSWSGKSRRTAVVNIDDEYSRRIYAEREIYPYEMMTFGTDPHSALRIEKESILDRITGIR